jgi:hypothetical protein
MIKSPQNKQTKGVCLMSDHIKKMLRITEPSLKIIDISYETIKNRQIIVIKANFSPNQKSCPNCGCTARNQFGNPSIVKNGKEMRTCEIRSIQSSSNDHEVIQATI